MPLEGRTTVVPHAAEAHVHERGKQPAPPGEFDILLAQKAVQLHCVQQWPAGPRCNNCHRDHPCPGYTWGIGILITAGWTDEQVGLLDRRQGAWA